MGYSVSVDQNCTSDNLKGGRGEEKRQSYQVERKLLCDFSKSLTSLVSVSLSLNRKC